MVDEFSDTGMWFLPSRPDIRKAGTIRYSPDEGAVLELSEPLTDKEDPQDLPLILGNCNNRGEITLFNCVTKEVDWLWGLTTSFTTAAVFQNVLFERIEDIQFSWLVVNFSHLQEWVNISGLSVEKGKDETIIKYRQPSPIVAVDGRDYTIRIAVGPSTHGIVGPLYPYTSLMELHLKQTVAMQIGFREEHPFESYTQIVSQLQNFLSFACLQPVYPIELTGYSSNNMLTPKDMEPRFQPINIYMKTANLVSQPVRLWIREMLFTLEDIGDELPTFLHNWFAKEQLLRPVYDLYLGTLYSPFVTPEYRFLSLVQAAESYHRRTTTNTELPREEHRRRLNAIVNADPAEYRTWLRDKLAFSNDLVLKTRIRELTTQFHDMLQDVIPNEEDFVNKVVGTRHYRTHFNEGIRGKSVEGKALVDLTEKLTILLWTCLLHEVGFSNADIKALLPRNSRYKAQLPQIDADE